MTTQGSIRFCTAADGVRLAMAVHGQGPMVLKVANWLSHITHETELFASRHWLAALGRDRCLVRYDARGCGLSQRDVGEVSLDAWVADLEAVADASGAGRCVLFGVSQGAAAAVAYAVRHPERVRGLILLGAFGRGMLRQGGSARVASAAEALIGLAELGWGQDTGAFRSVFTRHIYGEASAAQMQAFDDAHRHTVSGAMAARYMRVFYDIDVCDLAPRVQCPTLVMHSEGDRLVLFREGQLLAAMIPGAQFVPLRSNNHVPLESEPCWRVAEPALRGFLGALDVSDAQPQAPRLTTRQREVLRSVAAGQTDKQIARGLGLSPRTVEMHVAGALAALGARNRAEAVHAAIHWRLL